MKLYAGFRKHLRAVIGWNLTPSPDIVVIMRYRWADQQCKMQTILSSLSMLTWWWLGSTFLTKSPILASSLSLLSQILLLSDLITQIILSLRWWSGVPQDLLKTFSYISGALSPRSTVYHGGGGETLWLKICVSGVQFRHYIYQALCLGSMINHFSCMRFGRISREQIFLLLSFLFWGGHFGSWCQWF